jgi:menaquinone-specific isochorismate synthase
VTSQPAPATTRPTTTRPPGRGTRVTTVPAAPDGPLLAALPRRDGLAWLHDGEGLVGWGCHARCTVQGPDRFATAARWWRGVLARLDVDDSPLETPDVPGTGPVLFGSFAFDDDEPSSLVVPRVVIGRRAGRLWTTTLGTPTPDDLDPLHPPGDVRYADGGLDPAGWQAAVARAVQRIGAGELDKVVLARDLTADCEHPVDPRWLAERLAEGYPRCWTYSVDGLVGATPELLVRLAGGLVTSRVLAGTIPRSGDDARDLALSAALARSSKDLEEHEYAVRSVAAALAAHCTATTVPETPFVLHLPNVMHLASDIAGVVRAGRGALDLVAALHPTAAVCGTPTGAARRAIVELEGMRRGRYAGPVGWLDAAGNGEWGIALRCAQIDPGDPRRLRLFAGCGIVAGSDPATELAEAGAKFLPIREALAG